MNINLLVKPLQIFKIKLDFLKKVLTHPCSGVVRKSTETKKSKELKILAECQKVTHPNRISHYIMVAEVKKPKLAEKAKSLKSKKHHLTTLLRRW